MQIADSTSRQQSTKQDNTQRYQCMNVRFSVPSNVPLGTDVIEFQYKLLTKVTRHKQGRRNRSLHKQILETAERGERTSRYRLDRVPVQFTEK